MSIRPTDLTARVPGMMTLVEVALLMDMARLAPGVCIDVGCYLGLSACAMASATEHDVYAVDPFETRKITTPVYPSGFVYEKENEAEFLRNVERMGYADRVKLLRNTSQDAARRWRTPAGLVLIDADHNEAEADADAWARHVMEGGYLLLHDTNEPSVQAACAALEASDEWEKVRTANLLVAYKRIAPSRYAGPASGSSYSLAIMETVREEVAKAVKAEKKPRKTAAKARSK